MIGLIENKLVDFSASLVPLLGYPLHVESYAGQLDDPTELPKLMQKMPALLFAYIKDVPGVGGTVREPKRDATFAAIIATRNTRTEAASRQGSGDKVGSYQIRSDFDAILTGRRLGLDIDPIKIGPAKAVYNGKQKAGQLSVLLFEIRTGFTSPMRDSPEATPLPEFLRLYVEWTGRGEITTGPLPAPDDAPKDPQMIEVRS